MTEKHQGTLDKLKPYIPEPLFYEVFVKLIEKDLVPYHLAVVAERWKDVIEGNTSLSRRQDGVYQAAYPLEAIADDWFEYCLPRTFRSVQSRIGRHKEERLLQSMKCADEIDKSLKSSGIDFPCIIDCRAKSIYDIWRKSRAQGIEVNEVFDQRGVRLTVWENHQVYRLQKFIQEKFPLMPKYHFRNGKAVQKPIVNTLIRPWNKSIYPWGVVEPAIFNYIIIDGNIVEVQVCLAEGFTYAVMLNARGIKKTPYYQVEFSQAGINR